MQQIYFTSYYHGYNRWMNYMYDVEGHPQKEIILHRVKVIKFMKKHGEEATQEAYEVGRSTVYGWKKKLEEGGGKLSSLAPQSRAPHQKRKREVDSRIKEFMKKYRKDPPGVGKETIHPALQEYCRKEQIRCPSESTVGRILRDLKQGGEIQEYTQEIRVSARTGKLLVRCKKKRIPKLRRKGYQPQAPGDLVQLDSIFVFVEGLQRYLITAIDLKTGFAFAYGYSTLSSESAADFLERLREVTPFRIRRIQTDNGSEFEKHFRQAVHQQQLLHFHTYPRHPQSNAHIERFNRTLQEQYVSWHLEDLENLSDWNRNLMDYLLWYNTEKPHKAKNKLPPMKYFLDHFIMNKKLSNMLWTSTYT
jgi:putative transposase